ncbi:MAG: DUF927 domain-containing protein, partial [bacterium]|nr:DUF927 domain-containing protein [bacterium]
GDCGKLLDVALALRKRWPDREIAFVSDNDLHLVAKGKDNAGLVHAEAAAKAVGGAVALCPGEGDRGVDFADLYVEGRFDDIRDTVDGALEALRNRPEPSPGADVEPAEPSPAVVPADGGTRRKKSKPKTGDIDPAKVTEAKKAKLLARGYRLAGACSNRENVYVPEGFSIEDGRLLFRNDKNESVCFGFGPDAEEYEKLDDLGAALYVLGIGDDERGENLRVRVRWNDRDDKPREALIPLGLAGSRGGKLESLLLSLGYPMTEAGRKYIAGFFLASNPPGRFQIARRGGWHGNRFVLGNEVLGETQPGDPELLPETTGGETVFKVMGDVESWRKNVLPFVVGNSRLIFALCVGFAAPLLHYFPTVDGGIVHFFGATSCGKTTLCQLAASIYGNPATGAGGYVNTWNSTVNGLEGLASRFSDVLMILDEIGEAKPAAISDAAYMIANGRGRNRAKGDGTIRDSAAWRVMVVSSGEIPFSQYLRMGKLSPMAGQESRFVSLPADAGKGFGALDVARNNDSNTHIESLKSVLVQNYGALGRAWISYLCKRLTPDYVESLRREVLPSFINTLLDGRKACGEVKRVAGRFALVALAGEMANECFSSEDSPFFKPSPFQYIRQCFEAWLAERGGMDSSANESVLRKVREFLTEYGERRFKVISDNPHAELEPFRGDFLAGYRQNIGGVTAYFITADTLVKHIAPEYGKPVITGILSDAGWLRRDDGNHMTVRKMVDGKRRRFLQIVIPDDE